MKKLTLLMLCVVCAGVAQSVVVNVDFDARSVGTSGDGDGRTGTLFSGQGVYADSGNNYWTSIIRNGSAANVLASDGTTVTTVGVSISGGDGYESSVKTNYLLSDYIYNASTTTITGLEANGGYIVYVYAVGDQNGQGSTTTINGESQVASGATGATSNDYVLGDNYVVFESVTADATGQLVIESSAKINGFQLIEGDIDPGIYEAEDADYFGLVQMPPAANASGGYYLAEFDNIGDYINYQNVIEGDTLLITYFSLLVETRCSIYVNGVDVTQAVFPAGSSYAFKTIAIDLDIPANADVKLQIDADDRAYNNNGACAMQDNIEVSTLGDAIIVNSIEGLLTYVDQNDISVKMTPGDYYIDENDQNSGLFPNEIFFNFSGSNCAYDFTDVTLNVNTNIYNEYGYISTTVINVTGNNNHFFGLTLKDIGDEKPGRTALGMRVFGDYNKIEECSLYISGSFPYAYGDLFGKGSGYVIKHFKHSALLINGIGSHILNCYVEMHAYGHGIFMQGAVDTLVEGCYVKGFTRTTDKVLAEEGTGTDADIKEFMTVWGWPVPPGYMFSLSEDGIRCYNTGETSSGSRDTANTTVKNCTVDNMRGGVTIGFSNGINHVSGCTIIGGESGFWPGNGDAVEHCQAEAAYAAIINNPYQNDNDQSYSVTVLREAEVYGNEQLAYIAGSGHDVTFLNSGIQPRPYNQTIQMGGRKLGMRYMENVEGRNNYSLSNTTVTNWTDQPVALAADPNSSNCNVASYGPVTDQGTGNSVSSVSPVTVTASASTSTMYHTIDANAGTHWTADGDGQWIQYDLGQTRNLYAVSIQWPNGSTKRFFFDIQTSDSPTGPWTTVFSGASQGVTDDFEEYDFTTQNARYIRVTGHGNSVDSTIQIVDLEVDLKDRFAMVKTKSDAGASYVAQNTLDGDLNTRWAAEGDGQWIQYDLLKTKMINAIWLAWHSGNTRTIAFDIKTSDHPTGPWTTVYSGSSSGTTLQLEEYGFTPVSARFLRVTGHGNSQDSWNNMTEIFINTGPTYCGDGSGTFLNSDYNKDCRIDIDDFAEFAANWLGTYFMPDLSEMAADWSPAGYDY